MRADKAIIFVVLISFLIILPLFTVIRDKEVKPLWIVTNVNGITRSRPKKPLTIHCNKGQLGNQMNTYTVLYGLARYNSRIPQGLRCNMKHLMKVFDVTAKVIDALPFNDRVEYKLSDTLRGKDLHIPDNVTILTGYLFPRSYTFFHKFKEEIRKQFTFKLIYREYAEKTLLNLGRNHRNSVYVGMHIRRGDYCHHLKVFHGRMFDMKYLERAMAHFRQKYNSALFVVVSNDRKWCSKNLGNYEDVVISPTPPSFAHDLALLAFCNHSLLTYGSFGFWGAYLAGGETIYYTDYLAPHSKFLKMSPNGLFVNPPEWLGISTTPEGFWKNYTLPNCTQ